MARSKDEKSMIVSGAGLITGVVTALDKTLRAEGGTDDDWHRLVTPEGKKTIQVMADTMLRRPGQRWPLQINYRSLESMIDAGSYRQVEGSISLGEVSMRETVSTDVEVELFCLGHKAPTETVRKIMQLNDLLPADLVTLLTFGEKIPEGEESICQMAELFPIVALGSETDGQSIHKSPRFR